MLIKVAYLDKLICEVEKDCENTEETYREYITFTENAFGLENANLDGMSDEELTKYIDFLDELWCK